MKNGLVRRRFMAGHIDAGTCIGTSSRDF